MEEDLVEVAYVRDEHEAAVVQALLEGHGVPSLQQQVGPSGPQVGYGLMNPGGGPRRVMVHGHRAEEARALLVNAELLNEGIPDPANLDHLEEFQGRRGPRNYNLIGGYARAYFWSLAAMVAFFGVWLLLRALGLT